MAKELDEEQTKFYTEMMSFISESLPDWVKLVCFLPEIPYLELKSIPDEDLEIPKKKVVLRLSNMVEITNIILSETFYEMENSDVWKDIAYAVHTNNLEEAQDHLDVLALVFIQIALFDKVVLEIA